MTSGIKYIEQYSPVVLFGMLYEVVLTIESLDKIIKFKQFKYPNSACDPVEGDSGIFSCKIL